jgi:hypothetical protein
MNKVMTQQSPHDFASLGSALARARDEGVLDKEQFSYLAGVLAAGILSGTMRLGDYTAVHAALSLILEAVFNDPSLFASVPVSEESSGALDSNLEVIGDMWGSVDEDDEVRENVLEFVEGAFQLEEANFGDSSWFAAPLLVDFNELKEGLRTVGLSILRVEGAFNYGGKYVAIGDGDCCVGEGRMVLACGDRLLALAFRDEMP